MAHPALDDGEAVAHASNGQAQFVAEIGKRVTADIAQLHVLELPPEPFVGVELRGVGRQGLRVQVLGPTLSQEVLHDLGPVDRRAILDHEKLAGNMAQ